MNSISMVLSGRAGLGPLFVGNTRMNMMVDAVLQGYCGVAKTDEELQVASLSLGRFTVLGGDHSRSAARKMVAGIRSGSLTIAEGGWHDLMMQVHGDCIVHIQQTSLSSRSLNLDHLHSLMANAPTGYTIERIDSDLADSIWNDLSPDLIPDEVFDSPDDFVRRGIGFCALSEGRIVCAATSAVICDGAVEVRIHTNSEHRGKGLATAVGASFIAHCLTRGIEPHWTAENPHSVELAKKLGYTVEGEYDVLALISAGIRNEMERPETQSAR